MKKEECLGLAPILAIIRRSGDNDFIKVEFGTSLETAFDIVGQSRGVIIKRAHGSSTGFFICGLCCGPSFVLHIKISRFALRRAGVGH